MRDNEKHLRCSLILWRCTIEDGMYLAILKKWNLSGIWHWKDFLTLHTTNNKFEFPKDFIPRKYYDNVVGIYVNEELPVVNLKIRVYGVQMEYMRMLPLHKSQSEVKSRYGEFAEFSYRVCLTPELKSKILALGPNVEVLEPVEYREEIMSQISASLDRYMKKRVRNPMVFCGVYAHTTPPKRQIFTLFHSVLYNRDT